MRRLILPAAITLVISCKREKETSYYPDCFAGQTNTVSAIKGCKNAFVAAEIDNNRIVSVWLNDKVLALETKCKIFKIEDYTADIAINYYTYPNHPDSTYFNFCTDVIYPNYSRNKTTWKAVRGTVIAAISRDKVYRSQCEQFKISIRLDAVKFIKDGSTQDTTISTLIVKDRMVEPCVF